MHTIWELLLTFCIAVVDLLTVVVTIIQNNKKK